MLASWGTVGVVKNGRIFLVLGVCVVVVSVLTAGFVAMYSTQNGSGPTLVSPVVTSETGPAVGAVPPVVKVVAVASDTKVFHHDAVSAVVSFDTGSLKLVVPSAGETVRWFSPLGDMVDGGRLERTDVRAVTARIPAGLVVSVSYFDDGRQVSVLGVLASSPLVEDELTVYTVKIIDAPGRGSSYSTGGNYDIPSELESVSISITVVV